MSGRGWHLFRGEDRVLLARRWPARFDAAVTTDLPLLRLVPLVHMVRQDIWRALRDLRGFAPVVEARMLDCAGLRVTAGGQVAGPHAMHKIEDKLRAVLEDGATRDRWQRCAR